jgi:hypothetical protein
MHLNFVSVPIKSVSLKVIYNFVYRKVMLRVDAKQGAPKDAHYPLELFHVSIFLLSFSLQFFVTEFINVTTIINN